MSTITFPAQAHTTWCTHEGHDLEERCLGRELRTPISGEAELPLWDGTWSAPTMDTCIEYSRNRPAVSVYYDGGHGHKLTPAEARDFATNILALVEEIEEDSGGEDPAIVLAALRAAVGAQEATR